MNNLEYLAKLKDNKYRKLLLKYDHPASMNRKERDMIAKEIIAEELCTLNELLFKIYKIYKENCIFKINDTGLEGEKEGD